MTALTVRVTPLIKMVAPKLDVVYRQFLRALDAFAEAKMRNAVPQWQLREARHDINRDWRLIRPEVPIRAARAGR